MLRYQQLYQLILLQKFQILTKNCNYSLLFCIFTKFSYFKGFMHISTVFRFVFWMNIYVMWRMIVVISRMKTKHIARKASVNIFLLYFFYIFFNYWICNLHVCTLYLSLKTRTFIPPLSKMGDLVCSQLRRENYFTGR